MTVTITSIAKSQWRFIAKVIFYIAVAALCAEITAYFAGNPKWLVTYPLWQILGVVISQVLTQVDENALSNIPADVKKDVEEVAPEVVKPVEPVVPTAPVQS